MVQCTLIEGFLSDGLPMRLWLAASNGKLVRAALHDDAHPCTQNEFLEKAGCPGDAQTTNATDDVLEHAAAEVRDYFAGRRLAFDLPLELSGTEFQLRVWRQLTQIPFGEVRSYGAIATAIGLPSSSRAVGRANGANRLPLLVPCHRVIASGGHLGGFTGGVGLKKRLLAHEAAVLGRPAF